MSFFRSVGRLWPGAEALIAHHLIELCFIGMIVFVYAMNFLVSNITYPWWLRFGLDQSHPILTSIPVLVFIAGMIALAGPRRYRLPVARAVAWMYWGFGIPWALLFDPIMAIGFSVCGANTIRKARQCDTAALMSKLCEKQPSP